MKKDMKKILHQEVECCNECYFFTYVWQQKYRRQVRHRHVTPAYVCDHPYRFMLELPNTILVEGEEIDLKKDPRGLDQEFPRIEFPKWCPLKDKIDQGVRVGVTAIVVRNDKVLLGLRGDTCETARNQWAFPGGRMDYGEHPNAAISREIEEETGMTVKRKYLGYLTWMNEFFPDNNKHYISLVFATEKAIGQPKIIEPDKCKEWKWFDPYELPQNTFWACRENVERYRNHIRGFVDFWQ